MLAVPEAPPAGRRRGSTPLVAAVGTLVLMAILVGLFDRDSGSSSSATTSGWAERVGLSWDVGVDGISLWLLLLTAVIFLLAIARRVLARRPSARAAYLALLLLAETGLLGPLRRGATSSSSTCSGRRCWSRSTS